MLSATTRTSRSLTVKAIRGHRRQFAIGSQLLIPSRYAAQALIVVVVWGRGVFHFLIFLFWMTNKIEVRLARRARPKLSTTVWLCGVCNGRFLLTSVWPSWSRRSSLLLSKKISWCSESLSCVARKPSEFFWCILHDQGQAWMSKRYLVQ